MAALTTPCGSSVATASRMAGRPLPRRPEPEEGRSPTIARIAKTAEEVHGRLQRHRLRSLPRRAAPRHQAGQHHRRQAWRNAGRGLGPGQGYRQGRAWRSEERTLMPSPRPAAAPRRCPAQRLGHAGLHEPRTGPRRPRPAGPAVRRLQLGRNALLPFDRQAAVRGRRHRDCPAGRAAGAIPTAVPSSIPGSTRHWKPSA